MPAPIKELIESILKKNPHLRPTIDIILSNPIFDAYKEQEPSKPLESLQIRKVTKCKKLTDKSDMKMSLTSNTHSTQWIDVAKTKDRYKEEGNANVYSTYKKLFDRSLSSQKVQNTKYYS